jgi:hypothetical protein
VEKCAQRIFPHTTRSEASAAGAHARVAET